jgi:hypothetical protein
MRGRDVPILVGPADFTALKQKHQGILLFAAGTIGSEDGEEVLHAYGDDAVVAALVLGRMPGTYSHLGTDRATPPDPPVFVGRREDMDTFGRALGERAMCNVFVMSCDGGPVL